MVAKEQGFVFFFSKCLEVSPDSICGVVVLNNWNDHVLSFVSALFSFLECV